MKLRLFVGGLLACVTATSQAPAQVQAPVPVALTGAFDPSTLDPSVVMVVSGGRWDTGAHGGIFRVLMLRGTPGLAARSRVVVQWLEEHPVSKRLTLYGSRDVDAIPNQTWSLAAPRLELRHGQWYTVIVGTADAGRIRRTWRFALDAPGRLREVHP